MIHQRKKGFTLIELIIAITILAILAVGLIAALDPVEHLTKARDTTVRDNVDTIASAFERFYAVNETYDTTGYLAGMANNNGVVISEANGASEHMINNLVDSGELKSGFIAANSTNMGKIWIYRKDVDLDGDGGVDDPTPVVCAKVESKAFSMQKNLWTMTNNNRNAVSTSLTLGMPYPGLHDGVNCSLASTSGARQNCAFCVELQQ